MRSTGVELWRSSASSASAGAVRTLSRPAAAALRAVRARERSLTSVARTVAPGAAPARASVIGPQPHPRSRKVPVLGGSGTWSRRTWVPLSRRSALKTPEAVTTACSTPRIVKRWVRSSASTAGEAVK